MTVQLPKAMTAVTRNREQQGRLREYAYIIEEYFQAYNLITRVKEVNTETNGIQICIEIAVGTAVDDVVKHQKELAIILAAPYHRLNIEAAIPGTCFIGITIPWVYPYPNIPFPGPPTYRTEGMWVFRISQYFFQLAEKIGGPVLCRIGG